MPYVRHQWLKYSVYFTTVGEDVWSAQQVAKAYKVRWQIEIIFKSWKTGFKLQQILHDGCTNEHRVKVSIFLLLLYICLFMQKVYVRYKSVIERKTEKQLSLLKLAIYIGANITEIIVLPDKLLYQIVIKNCCFEKRKLRSNMTELYQNRKINLTPMRNKSGQAAPLTPKQVRGKWGQIVLHFNDL